MKIGALPDRGSMLEIGKWYFGLEIRKCPPSMIRVFKPWLFVWFVKVIDDGEPGKIGGRERKQKGGYRDFTFPYGISIQIFK